MISIVAIIVLFNGLNHLAPGGVSLHYRREVYQYILLSRMET